MRNGKLQFLEDMIVGDELGIIMMAWEHPLMKRHAEVVCKNGGNILEIGFGMGISAQYIQEQDIDSHTIIEIHPEIAKKAREWAEDKENVKIIESDWYDVMENLETYDGIFYDAEHDKYKADFYELIRPLLKSDGMYTFFNPQGDGIKNDHNIKENIRYEQMDINPPENPYINSNTYYLPMVEV